MRYTYYPGVHCSGQRRSRSGGAVVLPMRPVRQLRGDHRGTRSDLAKIQAGCSHDENHGSGGHLPVQFDVSRPIRRIRKQNPHASPPSWFVRFYRFNVDPVMAPTSHLLVYYTTEKGETINDVISFNVKQTDPKVRTDAYKIHGPS